ncbi:hypothetical protein QE450_004208 [Paenibacillus sp. SORGH_AS306]|nr:MULTISPECIES: hypothetical protein [unclassified Paenibacillus]MDQ1236710.1 hypothetical protein [Paenibacillus sp. SORGH_AS_0306]MDR6109067.1 hypothetical protein [Paenibacillus sp. SORGH_AS_0338]
MMICTPYITLKNGKVLHASTVGKKAFCFEVSEEKQKEYQEKKKNRK